MTATADPLPVALADGRQVTYVAPMLDLVIPVYNEEQDLQTSVLAVHQYLTHSFPFTFRITIPG